MPANPSAPPHAAAMLLIVSGVALVCGVSAVAAGLRSPGGSLEMAALVAPAVDHGMNPSFTTGCACAHDTRRAEADAAAPTRQPMAHASDVTPAPRRTRERFAGDGMGQSIVQSSDARNFLMRTAMARWRSAVKSRDESSGNGVVEANRAAVGGGFSNSSINQENFVYTRNRANSDTEWVVGALNKATQSLPLRPHVVCARFTL